MIHRKLIEQMLEALDTNHKHHQDYDDDNGYAESTLEVMNTNTIITAREYLAAPEQSYGWLAACDEEMVTAHIGVANLSDSYESAKAKLQSLIDWHIAVATDPAVNGGLSLQSEQSEPVMYQFRNIVEGEPRTEWEKVKPRNPHMGTVQNQITDLLAYRYKGQPSYEVRALYTTPQPTTPEPVNQMLLAALKKIASCQSRVKGDVVDIAQSAIAQAEQAPQPTELTDAELDVVWENRAPSWSEAVARRAFARAVLAAQKVKHD